MPVIYLTGIFYVTKVIKIRIMNYKSLNLNNYVRNKTNK